MDVPGELSAFSFTFICLSIHIFSGSLETNGFFQNKLGVLSLPLRMHYINYHKSRKNVACQFLDLLLWVEVQQRRQHNNTYEVDFLSIGDPLAIAPGTCKWLLLCVGLFTILSFWFSFILVSEAERFIRRLFRVHLLRGGLALDGAVIAIWCPWICNCWWLTLSFFFLDGDGDCSASLETFLLLVCALLVLEEVLPLVLGWIRFASAESSERARTCTELLGTQGSKEYRFIPVTDCTWKPAPSKTKHEHA